MHVEKPGTDAAPAPKVSFVSLGCPKALVDSERIVTRLRAEGYELSRRHEGADVVVVNTCGFLDSAKAESLASIGEALAQNGKVIVTGCMGAEPESITDRYPSVLAVTGPQQYESVMEAVHRAAPPKHDPFLDLVPPEGIKLTPRHYAYLKISEGCNNRCTFCIIPKLRGDLVSRPAADVLREAERLVKAGVKELLVISQDTSAYGVDLKYAASAWQDRAVRAKFLDLVRELGEFGAWVRLHYVYPYPHVDEVIGLMADGKVLPYLDIPFQHASPAVLKCMKRPAAQEKTLERIARWRETCPQLTIRSTFIVGFPGETEQDFEFLLNWLNEASLDRVGCFRYEPVKGAVANDLGEAVPEAVKEERWHRFMQRQQAISAKRLRRKVGTRQQVIIDDVGPARFRSEGAPVGRPESAQSHKASARSDAKPVPTFTDRALCVAKGRTKGDAPEIDGATYVASRRPLRVGDIVTAKIERAGEYDLHGTVVGF
ncbi:MAG TPA: 30S ribosomal protein S12 methylthiotransferase RimO [Xanthobacteraceae bacterium]|nr:30S ribosomal protein S12 methylthiotransferase RimO [Xanthobacteraceae bacterium]